LLVVRHNHQARFKCIYYTVCYEARPSHRECVLEATRISIICPQQSLIPNQVDLICVKFTLSEDASTQSSNVC
jgi:hypothetical protein